jgi:tetratricopeptide (TPR) repeat protein
MALTIRADDHLATALFERSLEAARRVDDPYVLSRTLLMAAWVPFWRNRLEEAEGLFREALETTRVSERPDPWAECRSLVGLASVRSPRGSEHEALSIAAEALEIGEAAGQPFTAAVAHQTVAASLRRMMRLDEALTHADVSVRTLRELGARWELASALGDRGSVLRMRGDLEDAERDLRESFLLCRDLSERALVTWTAAELARTLTARGDTAAARGVLDDPHRGRPRDRLRQVTSRDRGRSGDGAREPQRRGRLVDGNAVRCRGRRRGDRRRGRTRNAGAQRMAPGAEGADADRAARLNRDAGQLRCRPRPADVAGECRDRRRGGRRTPSEPVP